jgi:hypothetical protein
MEASRRERWRLRILRALLGRSGRFFVFGAADLMAAATGDLRRLPRLPRAYTVRTASEGDRDALGAFTGELERTARLLESGSVGLLAIADGAVQAMEWVQVGPGRYDWDRRRLGLDFALPARSCWLHNGRGAQEGLGPWAMVLGRLPAWLDERGIDVAFLQVASDNPYSIRCHESLGFRRVARVRALRVGPLRIVRLRANGRSRTFWGDGRLDLAAMVP